MSLIKVAQGIRIALTEGSVFRSLEGGVDGGNECRGGHVGEALVVKHIGDHLSNGELPGPDAGADGLAAEGGLSAPRVVGCKRLLVDGLEDGDGGFRFVA